MHSVNSLFVVVLLLQQAVVGLTPNESHNLREGMTSPRYEDQTLEEILEPFPRHELIKLNSLLNQL